jgi:hypothetical protein
VLWGSGLIIEIIVDLVYLRRRCVSNRLKAESSRGKARKKAQSSKLKAKKKLKDQAKKEAQR